MLRLLTLCLSYGISRNLHRWLTSFLSTRRMTMKVVVDSCESREMPIDSGVPQGTVLGPILFLCHINDSPRAVKSQVHLFADDCLLYHQINSQQDHQILQSDLAALEKWAHTWGVRFNAKKCYILCIHNKSGHFYSLEKTHTSASQLQSVSGGHNVRQHKMDHSHINYKQTCKENKCYAGLFETQLTLLPTELQVNRILTN